MVQPPTVRTPRSMVLLQAATNPLTPALSRKREREQIALSPLGERVG
jgi:hypothetical protein